MISWKLSFRIPPSPFTMPVPHLAPLWPPLSLRLLPGSDKFPVLGDTRFNGVPRPLNNTLCLVDMHKYIDPWHASPRSWHCKETKEYISTPRNYAVPWPQRGFVGSWLPACIFMTSRGIAANRNATNPGRRVERRLFHPVPTQTTVHCHMLETIGNKRLQ